MRLTYLVFCTLLMMINVRSDIPTGDWTYAYKVDSAGTKSESVHGVLCYKAQELPKKYQDVITPLGKFSFVNGHGLGSNEEIGWVPAGVYPDGSLYFAHTKQDIDSLLNKKPMDMRDNTSVQGDSLAIKSRPNNVGANWFYAIKDGLWINPAAK